MYIIDKDRVVFYESGLIAWDDPRDQPVEVYGGARRPIIPPDRLDLYPNTAPAPAAIS